MASPLLKEIEKITDALLQAAESGNSEAYGKQYTSLIELCFEYQDEEKNHPLQWEILADFTEDAEEAITYYRKALGFADEIQDFPSLTSIQLALTRLYIEQENSDESSSAADMAYEYAQLSQDQSLLREAEDIIKQLR